MENKVVFIGAGSVGLRAAEAIQIAIDRHIDVIIVDPKELHQLNPIRQFRSEQDNYAINMQPIIPQYFQEKIRSYPCTRHEYVEKKSEKVNGVQWNNFICRHCHKVLE